VAEAAAAIDLGGTHLRTAVVVDGRVVGRRHGRSGAEVGAQHVVDVAVGSLEQSIAEHVAAGGKRPAAVGVSAPGPLDPYTGVLLDPPNLHDSFRDFALADALAERLGLRVFLDRDTQVAALGEGRFGAARGLADFVYLTVSTGIGGAVVSDGRLLRGARGLAGELGHLQVDLYGPICGCGARGHLEAMSSGTGISRMAMAALESGASSSASSSALQEAAARAAPRVVSAAEVAAAEQAGDDLAAEIMATARRAFAAAMVSIVDVFAPRRVVVGGGVAMGQGERLLGPAREAVSAYAFREHAAQVEIVPAALGDDVGLLGAAVLVGERLRG
jgi:glucokinase